MNKLMKMATIVVGVGAMLSFAGCSKEPADECMCIQQEIEELLVKAGSKPFGNGETYKGWLAKQSPEEIQKELTESRAKIALVKEYLQLAKKVNKLCAEKGGNPPADTSRLQYYIATRSLEGEVKGLKSVLEALK